MSGARGRETADVPYDDEPAADEFQLMTDRLALALIDEGDVAEAYALLTDPRLTFLDPTVHGHEKVPTGGQMRYPLVATRSTRWWPAEVPTLH